MNSIEVNKGQLNVLIDEAMKNYDNISKKEIYKDIGVSLISLGLEPNCNVESKGILKPQESFNFKKEPISSKNLYVNKVSREIPAENAEKTGKDFWEIFKKKAKSNICGDKGIIKLFENGKIKEALEKVIPSIIIAMGISGLWVPAVTVIAIGILMLLLKSGIESLCELAI